MAVALQRFGDRDRACREEEEGGGSGGSGRPGCSPSGPARGDRFIPAAEGRGLHCVGVTPNGTVRADKRQAEHLRRGNG